MDIDWLEVVNELLFYLVIVPIWYAIMPRFFGGYLAYVKKVSGYVRRLFAYIVRE